MKRIVLLAGLAGCQPSAKSTQEDSGRWPVDPSTGLRIAIIPPLPPLEEWEDNESTEARKALGQAIFNDPRLSGTELTSCTSCHLPQAGTFHSGSAVDLPDRSWPELTPALARNTPALLNLVYTDTFHWDGRPSGFYEVWSLPFGEPQMNLTDIPFGDIWTTDDPTAQIKLKERFVETVPGYIDWFADAYDVDIRHETPEEIWELTGKAIAIYMRNIISRNSAFDKWNEGDDDAIDAQAIRGVELFVGKGACIGCHSGPLFSDFDFHNLSRMHYYEDGTLVDPGRARITGDEADLGKFLTPMLRSVTLGSPYFHDGQTGGLKDAVQYHVSAEARAHPNHDPILDFLPELTDSELEDIVAFLKTLLGEPIAPEYLTVSVAMP